LVPIAREVFDRVLGDKPNQKGQVPEGNRSRASDLLDVRVPNGTVTSDGVRTNIDVALQYLDAWLRGTGAAAIHNLMEDVATAEISRAQLWQWIAHRVAVDASGTMTANAYVEERDTVVAELTRSATPESRIHDAARLLDELVM